MDVARIYPMPSFDPLASLSPPRDEIPLFHAYYVILICNCSLLFQQLPTPRRYTTELTALRYQRSLRKGSIGSPGRWTEVAENNH